MTLLTGWGRTAATDAELVRTRSEEEIASATRTAPDRGVIARGLGRSYNDAAQNAGGRVIELRRSDRTIEIDPDGLARLDAGCSIDELLAVAVPRGWFVPVTPGTRQITVGGAIAADVHGKNHHVDGAFGDHVERMVVIDGRGQAHELRPTTDVGWWGALRGGMGLVGTIAAADVRLHAIETSLVSVDTERATDLDDLMERMESRDDAYRYSVAWVDLLTTGRTLGRGVLARGDFATADQLPPARTTDPLAFSSGSLATVPAVVPPKLLNRFSIRAFNELWYRRAPRHRTGELQSIGAFFHPLDGLSAWNRLYGASGFVQWQCVVPIGAEEELRTIVGRFAEQRCPTFLAVLKRFGPGADAPLSFPMPGWTLAVDVPAEVPGLAALLDDLDERVVEVGGRLYLAKDARVRPELVPPMYPRLDELRSVRAAVDPDGRFRSDLSRRLGW
ncbi:MAG: FAD-binding oxidoreductase [Actinomycetota bacterium]